MQKLSLEQELKNNAYPGRGIVIGKSPNGKYAVTAYWETRLLLPTVTRQTQFMN